VKESDVFGGVLIGVGMDCSIPTLFDALSMMRDRLRKAEAV